MSEVLRPCPFCGGDNILFVEEKPGYGVICCGDCHFSLPDHEWELLTEEKAAEAWNRRAERTCVDVMEPPRGGGFWPSPTFRCSACGAIHVSTSYVSYCPSCGARVTDGGDA